jgi:DNA/RNA endonuclease YhcR with UshA esterase domain
MLEREERMALLLLAGVAAIVLLSALTVECMGKDIFASPFSAASKEGELVVLEGVVTGVRATAEGDHLIVTIDTTTVFLPSPIAAQVVIQEGERIRVTGIVQRYRGDLEIVPQSSGDITHLL